MNLKGNIMNIETQVESHLEGETKDLREMVQSLDGRQRLAESKLRAIIQLCERSPNLVRSEEVRQLAEEGIPN